MLEEEEFVAKLTLRKSLSESDVSDVLLHGVRMAFRLVVSIDLEEHATDGDSFKLGHEVLTFLGPIVAKETSDIGAWHVDQSERRLVGVDRGAIFLEASKFTKAC